MYAITTNTIDLLFVALMLLCPVLYVCVRHYLYVRSTRTMQWSTHRYALRAMRRHL